MNDALSLIPQPIQQAIYPVNRTQQVSRSRREDHHQNAACNIHDSNNAQRAHDIQETSDQSQAARLSHTTLLHRAQRAWQRLFQASKNVADDIRVLDGNRPIQLSIENQRTNEIWGDGLMEKSDHTTRLCALNVHGLSLDRKGGQFDDLCKVVKEVQADVICGQEMNVDATQSTVRSIMYNTSRQNWQSS
jgi:hypothetical protein